MTAERPSGPRLSTRVPTISAVIAIAAAAIAAIIPVVTARSAGRDQAVEEGRAAVDRSADLAKEQLRGWVADRTSEVECLAGNPHFEAEVAEAIALVTPEDNDKVAREINARSEEDHEKQLERIKARAAKAKERVLKRLKTFQSARPSCKRLMIAHKSSIIVISTEASDENGSFGGSLISNAIGSDRPIAHVSKDLAGQVGGQAVVASRSAGSQFVVVGAFDMGEVFEPLSKIASALGPSGRVIVTDGRGHPILGGLEKLKGKAIESEAVKLALGGKTGSIETTDESDKLVLAAHRALREGGLALVMQRELDDIRSAGVPIQVGGLIGALAIALLGAVLIAVVGRKLLSGLGYLSLSAGKVASGDLGERAPVEGDDEVSFIAKVFNDVLGQLQHGEGGAPATPSVPAPAPAPAPATSGPTDQSLGSLRRRLMAADDRHGLASGLLEVVWGHAQPVAVAVYVRDPGTGVYTVLSSRGLQPEGTQALTSGQGAAGRCAATGEAVGNDELPWDERSRLSGGGRGTGLSQLALPMRAGAEVLGVLEVIGGKTASDDELLGLSAVVGALGLSRLQERARATKLAEQAERLLSERDGGVQ